MRRHVITLAVLALAITAALGVYALQPPVPAPEGAPETPEEGAVTLDVGIQEAADMACSRLRSNPVDDYWSTPKNTPITASPLANDPDNEQQNFGGIVSGPSHGTAEVIGLDAVKYTPSTNYVGSDSFTYMHIGCLQCSGSGWSAWCSEPDSDIATVHITVTN
jgi:hypothetical protein